MVTLRTSCAEENDAYGLNPALRANLLDFNFPLSQETSEAVAAGMWYCPFMFIKEGKEKHQIRRLSGQQGCGHQYLDSSRDPQICGREAVQVEKNDETRVVWLGTIDTDKGAEKEVGLSRLIVGRMIWEEERGGWIKLEEQKRIRVAKEEKCEEMCTSYGCYVLVESLELRRNDGSFVLTYDFRHIHQLSLQAKLKCDGC
ncbi:hypothetical protein Cgig2_019327 [Carnegiea gigantea]|uniref:Uncharacterized protein n=1 Tax=Carnegiea gigantea TaxID=171969 RepID=A0A9Q1KMU9_9CARY|nr:hypothetical protein Cgig2_019327 [Carnegiea gigantea]